MTIYRDEKLTKKIAAWVQFQDSPYFFSNSKTFGLSVDFRVCPMMLRDGDRFYSKTCKGCYSATILNVYPNLRNKISNLPQGDKDQYEIFEESCRDLSGRFPFINKIRFYSLSDFHADDIPFIHIARKYFIVDIISKLLVFPKNRVYLRSLINVENVWISLSFNKNFNQHLDDIKDVLESENAENVQLNYMMNYLEEDPTDPYFDDFSVLHFINKKKREALTVHPSLEESRICAIFDKEGKPVMSHGSCDQCNHCHNSYLSRILTKVKG